MSTGTSPAPQVSPQRSVPRYKLTVPADVTVLRSGIPENIPGRTLELGEGGVGVVIASKLLLGESVRVEFLLPRSTSPVRATAVVKYQRELCCGLQFVRLPAEQHSTIRYWTRCEAELSLRDKRPPAELPSALPQTLASPEVSPENPRRWVRWVVLATVILALTTALQWWYWQREWTVLESQLPDSQVASAGQLLTVPGDVMQQRIRHRVAPEYPPEARRAGIQGTVMLHVVVSAAGIVTDVDYLSGPEALSRSAMDAVRWSRFDPYLVNGRATPVATTIPVDFRLVN